MNTILIKPKNKRELVFLSEMFNKMKIETAELNLEELEEVAFGYILEQEDKSKTVPMSKVLKRLARK